MFFVWLGAVVFFFASLLALRDLDGAGVFELALVGGLMVSGASITLIGGGAYVACSIDTRLEHLASLIAREQDQRLTPLPVNQGGEA